ncbi:lipoprotein insertase outer membrane protein LolB [Herminiimonas arsenitoxidans]|uniref:lipoprotein insertase outer membrane protein LolB n=1 Tax=Herminiimonas arsenitoxidans TaxID=1809410 RepID=UPI001E2CE002|nr:lipoprotein insertase outer membrane protein LolB [Herminiimonas arsenitoxidans]
MMIIHTFPSMHAHTNAHTVTRKLSIAIALSALLMTGCANLTPQADSSNLAGQTSVQRTYKDALALDGRLSVQYQKNDQDEALHGNFTWNQSKDRSDIAILSPLGQVLATIAVTPDSATLTQAGKTPITANDVDLLITQTLGWPLPISGLRNWLQGFAIDANNAPFVATPGNTNVTTRDGWRIQYLSWQDDNQTPAQSRPKRIDLERQTEQAGKVAIRIVIDNWQTQ